MYRVSIKTSNFKKLPNSKRNWERALINDYMHAINGWEVTENDIVELTWRLNYFFNGSTPSEKYDTNSDNHSKALLWDAHPNNSVTYYVRALDEQRTRPVQVWGIAQGYISPMKIIDKLNTNGEVSIDFSKAYDIRQRESRIFKGAYLKIEKVV